MAFADRLRGVAYRRWWGMINRCTNPSDAAWKWYGARGISVCPEWVASFETYYADVGDCPAPGLSLDRRDNDGPYAPWNVRWATAHEQTMNSRHAARLKTACDHGHEFTDANTHIDSRGRRACRACSRRRVAESTARRERAS